MKMVLCQEWHGRFSEGWDEFQFDSRSGVSTASKSNEKCQNAVTYGTE